jgi:hypothetical protein
MISLREEDSIPTDPGSGSSLRELRRNELRVAAAAGEKVVVPAGLGDGPSSRTRMRSASRTVLRRWAITISVQPRARTLPWTTCYRGG